jgi:hypothetical protein
MAKLHTEETKKKMAEAAKKRWDTLTPKEEIAFRKKRSKGMKRAWARKSKDELAQIGVRMSARKKAFYMKEQGVSEEEVDKFLVQEYGITFQELEEDSAKRRERTWKTIQELKAQGKL